MLRYHDVTRERNDTTWTGLSSVHRTSKLIFYQTVWLSLSDGPSIAARQLYSCCLIFSLPSISRPQFTMKKSHVFPCSMNRSIILFPTPWKKWSLLIARDDPLRSPHACYHIWKFFSLLGKLGELWRYYLGCRHSETESPMLTVLNLREAEGREKVTRVA